MKANFKNSFSEALRVRLYPNTALHSDQLAFALGYEGATIRNWLRGSNRPSGEAVALVIQFFYSRGDAAFMAEIMPGITPLFQRKREDEEAAAVGYALKKFMQSGAMAA